MPELSFCRGHSSSSTSKLSHLNRSLQPMLVSSCELPCGKGPHFLYRSKRTLVSSGKAELRGTDLEVRMGLPSNTKVHVVNSRGFMLSLHRSVPGFSGVSWQCCWGHLCGNGRMGREPELAHGNGRDSPLRGQRHHPGDTDSEQGSDLPARRGGQPGHHQRLEHQLLAQLSDDVLQPVGRPRPDPLQPIPF